MPSCAGDSLVWEEERVVYIQFWVCCIESDGRVAWILMDRATLCGIYPGLTLLRSNSVMLS